MVNANLNPYFLPWQQQGVDFLLSPSALAPEVSLCHMRQESSQQNLGQNLGQNLAQTKPQDRQENEGTQNINQAQENKLNAYRQQIAQRTQQARQENMQNNVQEVRANKSNIPLLEQLPPAWQERLNATKPNRVAFTYWSLGYDLYGQASDARRQLLKKIIVEDLQKGFKDYSLWPVAIPLSQNRESELELHANAQAFWTGLHQLEVRGLVIFGSNAAKAVGLREQAEVGKFIQHQSWRVLFVNDIDYLVEKKIYYPSMMASLRLFLRQFLYV